MVDQATPGNNGASYPRCAVFGILSAVGRATARSIGLEFLKVDFPRIPYPKSATVFDKLVAFGGELRNAHLLKVKHSQFEKVAAFAVDGENVVEGVRFEDGRVYINATQYFDKVSEDIFHFYIGGYQPAQKWLKDRKGRALTNDDCDHYQSIILALIKTRDVMTELSKFSSKWWVRLQIVETT